MSLGVNQADPFRTAFDGLTGAGVTVGIIDSGYSPGGAASHVVEGVDLTTDREGVAPLNWSDRIGHGTACAGIISRKAPNARLFPIKVFANDLVTDTGRLIDGIEWGVEHGLKVLNLSLGTTETAAREELAVVCKAASEKRVLLVAATSNDGRASWPASLPGVFGVAAGKVTGKYSFFFQASEAIQFIARGDPQRLDWIDGHQVFLGGSSFAAPHVTAILALLLERYPGATFEDLCSILERLSLPERPTLVDPQTAMVSLPSPLGKDAPERLGDLHQQTALDWVKRAVIYPYNKEMHSLVRGRTQLCFELTQVVDVVGGRCIGRDSGAVIGIEDTGIVVHKDLEGCLGDVDTVVVGYLDQISRIKGHDHLRQVLDLALEHGKNVYSLSPLDVESYADILSQFRDHGLHVTAPMITYADFEQITARFDWRHESQKPVVGVFGTSPSQGKFTTQLALRRELQSLGYKVGQVGTEHQSALFGFDFTFPNGYDGLRSVRIPLDLHTPLLQSVMAGIEQDDPDIIIVGTQSGVIPHSFAEKTPGYTLTTLAVLFGTLPDAYVLVVNSMDEEAFIQQTMDTLKALGKGKTIALVFSDKRKEEKTHLGRSFFSSIQMSAAEMAATAARLESRFQLPVTEVVTETGRQKLVTAAVDFFGTEAEASVSSPVKESL